MITFLLGIYVAIAVVVFFATMFLKTLGGKRGSVFFTSLIAGVFWPFTILYFKHFK